MRKEEGSEQTDFLEGLNRFFTPPSITSIVEDLPFLFETRDVELLRSIIKDLYDIGYRLNSSLEEVYPISSDPSEVKSLILDVRELLKSLKSLSSRVKDENWDEVKGQILKIVPKLTELSDRVYLILEAARERFEGKAEDLKAKRANPYLYLTLIYLKASLKARKYLEVAVKNFNLLVDLVYLYELELNRLSSLLEIFSDERIRELLNDLRLSLDSFKICLKELRKLIDDAQRGKLSKRKLSEISERCNEIWTLFKAALEDLDKVLKLLSPLRTSLFRELDLGLLGLYVTKDEDLREKLVQAVEDTWNQLVRFMEELKIAVEGLKKESVFLEEETLKDLGKQLEGVLSGLKGVEELKDKLVKGEIEFRTLEGYRDIRDELSDFEVMLLELLADFENLRYEESSAKRAAEPELKALLIAFERARNRLIPVYLFESLVLEMKRGALYWALSLQSAKVLRKSLFDESMERLQELLLLEERVLAEVLSLSSGLKGEAREDLGSMFAELMRDYRALLAEKRKLVEVFENRFKGDNLMRLKCFKCGALIEVDAERCPKCSAVIPDTLFKGFPFIEVRPPQELYHLALILEMNREGKISPELLEEVLYSIEQNLAALSTEREGASELPELWRKVADAVINDDPDSVKLWNSFVGLVKKSSHR